jgi:hypothetical protein
MAHRRGGLGKQSPGDTARTSDGIGSNEISVNGCYDDACVDRGEQIDSEHRDASMVVDDDSLIEHPVHDVDY